MSLSRVPFIEATGSYDADTFALADSGLVPIAWRLRES